MVEDEKSTYPNSTERYQIYILLVDEIINEMVFYSNTAT